LRPAAVISLLKLAGPSPQPKIRKFKSASDRLNINLYSSNDLPHGTTSSSFIIDSDQELATAVEVDGFDLIQVILNK
jgi:hypothetical protein